MKQICHRDLKLENTLLDGSVAPRLKICDFGYSKVAFVLIFHFVWFNVNLILEHMLLACKPVRQDIERVHPT